MNYNIEMKKQISLITGTPNILLHSCCGPCSTTCINILSRYFNVFVIYYNPNIEPKDEYIKRKNEQIKFIEKFNLECESNGLNKVSFIDCDYDNDSFMEELHPMGDLKEGGARCFLCIKKRLEYTARYAKENNFDFFATTLTVSPHKNSEFINKTGINLSSKYNINFLCSDFKKEDGYLKSINYSKEFALYRQNYCGCRYSINKINE